MSSKYQSFKSVDREEAGAPKSVTVDPDGLAGTSLQPYMADGSFEEELEAEDPSYQSIERYNKNNLSLLSGPDGPTSNMSVPSTPSRRSTHYNRSSSPIPVLLRSASSLLSQSMKLPAGSLRASTFTVITGMVGGGTFTFSYGVYKAGMFAALFYLAVIASLAGYTTHSIVYCAERNNCPSYRSLAKKLFGAKFAIFMQLCLCTLLWMVCISYMTLTRNLLSKSISSLTGGGNHWFDNNVLLLLMASVLPTYLALKRRVSALRYASLFGLIVVICSTSLVVITFFNWCSRSNNDPGDPSEGRECLVDSVMDRNYWYNSHLLGHSYTIALFFGGFAAQFTILPIYFEMQKRSPRNMTKCIGSGFGFTFCIYCFVAYFGYWTYPNPSKDDQNLINLYHDYLPMLIAQILLALYVMSVIPLFAHAFRKTLTEIIAARNRKKRLALDREHNVNARGRFGDYGVLEDSEPHTPVCDGKIIEDAVENAHLAWVPTSPEAKKFVERKRKETGTSTLNEDEGLPLLQHVVVTMLFLCSAFAVAVFANNIGQVNSIISSTMLPMTCYIFPFMCTLRTRGASLRMRVLTGTMSVLSVFNAVMFFYDLATGQT